MQQMLLTFHSISAFSRKPYDIYNSPSRIYNYYNIDESGMPLDHKPPKVIVPKGTKKVHCRTSGNKSQITVLACANAAGSVIPPMVIFEGKRLNPEWTKGEVPDTLHGMSEKGWTDMELFNHWMQDHFMRQIPPARPVMLLLDGHSSHYEPETIRFPAKEGVVIFCLYHPTRRLWSHRLLVISPGGVSLTRMNVLFAWEVMRMI